MAANSEKSKKTQAMRRVPLKKSKNGSHTILRFLKESSTKFVTPILKNNLNIQQNIDERFTFLSGNPG